MRRLGDHEGEDIHMKAAILFFSVAALAFAQDQIPAGTNISVRTDEPIRINNAQNGDGRIYTGMIGNDVMDRDGRIMIPRGATAELIARRIANDEVSIDLEAITVRGHRYAVFTTDNVAANREGVGANRRTGKFVGGGAVLGTLLGAVAGGGKGAAIGALAGAGAGASAEMLTRGKHLNIPAESILNFRLEQPLRIDVKDRGVDRDGHHYHDNWDRFQKP